MVDIVTLLAPVLVQLAPPPPVPPPPPPPPLPREVMTRFDPGSVTCDGTAVQPIAAERPIPWGGYDDTGGRQPLVPFTITFRIDNDGRPLGITRRGAPEPDWLGNDDVEPALVTWRFARNAPHDRCEITFSAHADPVSLAPRDALARFYALTLPRTPTVDHAFWQMVPDDSTCFRPSFPAALVRVMPDFDAIPQRRGTRSYSLIEYDIAVSGKPVGVHVLASDGNRVLDAASIRAVRRSRFVRGARHACLLEFHRTPIAPTLPPPKPDLAALRPADSDCQDKGGDWTSMPPLVYPKPFNRRDIEGWVAVRYDVAPWGETGDVEAVASEPADGFDAQAVSIVREARQPPTKHGLYGCIDLVRFRIRPPGRPQRMDDRFADQ